MMNCAVGTIARIRNSVDIYARLSIWKVPSVSTLLIIAYVRVSLADRR
ncbi:hypothetical protein NKJ72_17320 [Mesorhizobium sp. M0045]